MTSSPSGSALILRIVKTALLPLLLSLGAAIACYAVSGVSLGLFFGTVLLVTFMAPPLTVAESSLPMRLIVCAALTLGIWTVWLATVNLSLFDALRCGMVLAAYVIALAGVTAILVISPLGPTFASALTALFAAAWLTWPVWLCPWLSGPHAQTIVQTLTVAHPLMALNGVLFERFNFWDRYTLAYQQLTTLNQDILYTLPHRVIWMVLVHGGAGLAGVIGWNAKCRRSQLPLPCTQGRGLG